MYAIFTPIANVLGFVLNLLFEGMYKLGIGNVGLAIILFTLIVKLCMMPLTVKQPCSRRSMPSRKNTKAGILISRLC